jgi:hypothetical protein
MGYKTGDIVLIKDIESLITVAAEHKEVIGLTYSPFVGQFTPIIGVTGTVPFKYYIALDGGRQEWPEYAFIPTIYQVKEVGESKVVASNMRLPEIMRLREENGYEVKDLVHIHSELYLKARGVTDKAILELADCAVRITGRENTFGKVTDIRYFVHPGPLNMILYSWMFYLVHPGEDVITVSDKKVESSDSLLLALNDYVMVDTAELLSLKGYGSHFLIFGGEAAKVVGVQLDDDNEVIYQLDICPPELLFRRDALIYLGRFYDMLPMWFKEKYNGFLEWGRVAKVEPGKQYLTTADAILATLYGETVENADGMQFQYDSLRGIFRIFLPEGVNEPDNISFPEENEIYFAPKLQR